MAEHLQEHPPLALEFPVKHKDHDFIREDPWHWLREREDPRVLAHLEAENAYTDAVMAAVGDLPEKLYAELVSRIEESNVSAPYPKGGYLYQSRIDKGQNYRMYFRKPRDSEADWGLYFDSNREAEGLAYFDLGFLDVSPDERLLAYAVDSVGEESFNLQFRDLTTGLDLPESFEAVSADGEWDASGGVFYFVGEDDSKRPYQIFRYRIGTPPKEAELVFEETDPLFYAGIYKSQDGRYLFICSESKETSEVRYLEAADTSGAFKVLFPRCEGIQYWVDHQDGEWLVRSDEGAPDYKLMALPVGCHDPGQARLLVPPREGVRLLDVLPLKNFRILIERSGGLDRLRIQDLAEGSEHGLAVPDSVYDIQPGINLEYDTRYFQFIYSSPIRPLAILRYDLVSRESTILRQTTVPSGHDPELYTAYRLLAPSHDGVHVPITVFHRKDLPMDGSRPAYLYGYGAYGEIEEASFRRNWLTWLERGFTVAIAHIRGGGLLGEQWYQDGKLDKKENTFLDFIACAEALIGQNYTRPDRLLIEGGSAGGLLIGAVLNRRPDLFRAAVAAVPFVDVLNTMLDPSLPLTTFEYEEWGNPSEKAFFDTLKAYSPYENVRPAAYPALLVTAGFNDPRVPYWEAAKWVAKLRKHQTGPAPILLKTQLEAGHSGATGRYDTLRETAFEQAFLLWRVSDFRRAVQ